MLRCVYFILYVYGALALAAPVMAQRVYASSEQSPSDGLLRSITNRNNAKDNSLTTYSSINVLASLGLTNMYQNIQFATGSAPLSTSPIYVKFAVEGTLIPSVSILSRITLAGTLNTVLSSLVYTGSSLLSLLGLGSSSYTAGTVVTATVGGNGTSLDGVELSIDASVLTTVNLYGAFYITPPAVSNIDACSGTDFLVPITNFFTGYSYKVYQQASGGSAIGTFSNASSMILTAPTATGNTTYYIEALDGGYLSARIPFIVNVLPEPTLLSVQLAN